jgi:hypothetical protein
LKHRVFRITASGLISLSKVNFSIFVIQDRKISDDKKPQAQMSKSSPEACFAYDCFKGYETDAAFDNQALL